MKYIIPAALAALALIASARPADAQILPLQQLTMGSAKKTSSNGGYAKIEGLGVPVDVLPDQPFILPFVVTGGAPENWAGQTGEWSIDDILEVPTTLTNIATGDTIQDVMIFHARILSSVTGYKKTSWGRVKHRISNNVSYQVSLVGMKFGSLKELSSLPFAGSNSRTMNLNGIGTLTGKPSAFWSFAAPEPGSLALLALGGLAGGLMLWQRRK